MGHWWRVDLLIWPLEEYLVRLTGPSVPRRTARNDSRLFVCGSYVMLVSRRGGWRGVLWCSLSFGVFGLGFLVPFARDVDARFSFLRY